MPQADLLADSKLLLLYTIWQKQTVSIIELSDFIVFKGYIDYFTMQDLLAELTEAGLLEVEDTQYSITDAGLRIIETFQSRLPASTRADITEYARTSAFRRSSMLEASAEIVKAGSAYEVRCRVTDYDREIFSIVVPADSEAKCFQIRNNWQQKGLTLYRSLIAELGA